MDSRWRLCNINCLFTLKTILIGYRLQNNTNKQERILVGCVTPACQPYMLWWPLLGVSTRVGGYPRYHVWGVGGYTYLSSYSPPSGILASALWYTRSALWYKDPSGRTPPHGSWTSHTNPPVNRHTLVKTLPSLNFVGGRWQWVLHNCHREFIFNRYNQCLTFQMSQSQ